ncbi:hypothetical protein P7K49_031732, partial [Saguinus oedipus]
LDTRPSWQRLSGEKVQAGPAGSAWRALEPALLAARSGPATLRFAGPAPRRAPLPAG